MLLLNRLLDATRCDNAKTRYLQYCQKLFKRVSAPTRVISDKLNDGKPLRWDYSYISSKRVVGFKDNRLVCCIVRAISFFARVKDLKNVTMDAIHVM